MAKCKQRETLLLVLLQVLMSHQSKCSIKTKIKVTRASIPNTPACGVPAAVRVGHLLEVVAEKILICNLLLVPRKLPTAITPTHIFNYPRVAFLRARFRELSARTHARMHTIDSEPKRGGGKTGIKKPKKGGIKQRLGRCKR